MSQNVGCDFSHPALICGSNWALIFQRYYKNGDFESMLKLTSEKSIAEYGIDTVRQFYQMMDFAYTLKLKSWTRDNAYYILNYTATIYATEVLIRIKLIQGDTAKIVLPYDFRNQKYFLYK